MDGYAVATKLLNAISRETSKFTVQHGRRPCLATVLVGDDPASHTYVRMKRNGCAAGAFMSVGRQPPRCRRRRRPWRRELHRPARRSDQLFRWNGHRTPVRVSVRLVS
ncbi:tetrahydrofolate dehydrogenase/cyclohydrolase catalytic domain-containing protein [Rhodococcus pyridinivorans]|uniref:tetrahydrofolate dehydrogenase/cyclohydrolase catalytic domain-containing protein n=1 Tax=Rhodococcus pyridinivorans TaxID=103816 RepID=UPI0039B53D1C